MNFMRMITLLQTGYTTIEVVFPQFSAQEPKPYVYKTRDKCAPGDTFVVDTPRGLRCVTVSAVHDTPRIDPDKPFNYKWTVMKVDRANYDEQVAKEKEAVLILEEAEREKAKKLMLDELKGSLPADPETRNRLNKLIWDFSGGKLQLPN